MTTLTIINDKNMRGIIAPTANLPKHVLEDMIDLVELSTAKEGRASASRARAKRSSWTPLRKIARKR